MKEKMMPALVLTIICIVVSGLLVFAYNFTKTDKTGQLSQKQIDACVMAFGQSNYKMLQKGGKPMTFKQVTNVITDELKSNIIFEVVADGYTKDGIDAVIGLDKSGKVTGIGIVTLKETPGLGTKVTDKTFLDKFLKADETTDLNKIDSITGATYSSKGIKSAVEIALKTYNDNKEAILSELS